MSITTCRQCRKTIPADSVRCPTCDILNPGKRDFLAVGVTLIVVLGVVYAGWRTVAWITTPSEDTPSLTAEVRFSDSQIQIENNDTYAWTFCTVTLNSGIRGSWSQELGRIPAGETVAGGLMAFTRGRGERFNPVTHAVQDVLIDCDTPEGRRYYSGRAR